MSSLGKKLGAALLMATMGLSLTACKDIEGDLQVRETLQLNVMKGNSVVPPGVYGIKVKTEPDRVRLEIKIEGKNNNPVANFKLHGQQLPSYNGTFHLVSSETGQPYDAVGDLQTNVQETPVRSAYRSCSIPRYIRECKINDKNERVCRDKTVYDYGEKLVHEHDRTTTQFLRIELVSPVDGHSVASGDGTRSESQTITDYEGPCYLR